MKRYGNPDYVLFAAAAIATLFGIIAVWDAGYAESAVKGEGFPRAVLMQSLFALAGLAGCWLISRLPAEKLRKYAWPAVIVTGLLLVGVLVLGKPVNGATRWFRFGPASFQPSEVAKLTCILFLASAFAGHTAWKPVRTGSFRLWLGRWLFPKIARAWPLIPVVAVVGLIELQPDLKTAMVILFTSAFILIAAGVSGKSFATVAAVVALVGAAAVVDKPYRLTRILSHNDRWSESKIDSIGFQTTQSETALAMGGVLGKGFGQGRAKYTLPEPTSDFVLATIGEEAGLVGSLAVIGLLGFIVWRLYRQGMERVDRFQKLALVGIACWIAIQTVANVVVANGAIPVMGVPLPFFSAGGSSLLALWLAIGVAQSVVRSPNILVESSEPVRQPGQEPARRAYVR